MEEQNNAKVSALIKNEAFLEDHSTPVTNQSTLGKYK